MIKAILFDNDGVLVDTEQLFFEATRDTLATRGIPLDQARFVEISLVQGNGLLEYVEGHGLTEDEFLRLKVLRNRRYANYLKSGDLTIPGVRETLQQLHGDFTLGVVTSSRRDHFDIIHSSTGLLPFFDFVLSSESYEKFKPHPEPYLKGLDRASVAIDECVAVEDSPRGVASALAAGLQCFVVPTPLCDALPLAKGAERLGSIRDLPGRLDLLNRPS